MILRCLVILLLGATTRTFAAPKGAGVASKNPSPASKAAISAPPAQKVYPVALPNYDEETATRLQIFLDNADFGPGKIDGKMGEFFRKALISYKHAHAMPKTGAVDNWLLDQVPVTYTTYTVRPDDSKLVGPLPTDHAEQA